MATLIELALKGGDRMPWNEVISLHATQTYDDHESDVKNLLHISEVIIEGGTNPEIYASRELRGSENFIDEMERDFENFIGEMEPFNSTITNISRELTCKPGEDEDEKTLKIIKALSNFSWKTKMTLALAAFSIKYGKLRLLKFYSTKDPLAKTVALLRQQPVVLEDPLRLKSWFIAVNKLISAMVEWTKWIVNFKEATENQDRQKTYLCITTAVYWTIKSAVVCSSQIIAVLVMHHRGFAPYEWSLDDLTKKLESIKLHRPPLHGPAAEEHVQHAQPAEQPGAPERTVCLSWMQGLCLQGTPSVHSDRHAMVYQRLHSEPEIHLLSSTFEDETMYAEAYEQLVRHFDTSYSDSDSIDILKALVDQEDQPLLDGSTKERVSMDALKSKMVLLFISDLDLCHEELQRYSKVFLESRTHPKRLKNQYEVVWLPVVDTSMSWKEKRHNFGTIQSWIPWYSIYYPSLIRPAAIKYIKEVWQFNGKPLIVVLDSQGKVVNHNAIHMIRIWGSQAFPFTQLREEMLWKNKPCGIDFLVDSVDATLTNRIAEYRYICLWGGEHKEWIQRFTSAVQETASTANIPLELFYIGSSCSKDMCQSNISRIVSGNLSHVIQDLSLIKFFWLRLESIIESRLSVVSAENDPLTQGLKTLLNFNKDEKSWALISRKESMIMCIGNGEDVLKGFMEYSEWKENSADMGFLPAFSNYLHELQNLQNSKHPVSPDVSPGTQHRSHSNFLWRRLSCFVDPPVTG